MRTLCSLVVLAFSTGAMAGDPKPHDAKSKAVESSLETFSGTWEIVTVQPVGSAKEAKRLVFRKDRTYAALDADGKELWAGTFDLDPTAMPESLGPSLEGIAEERRRCTGHLRA